MEWPARFVVPEGEKKQAKSAFRTREGKQPLWRLAHFIDTKGQVDNANHVGNGDLSVAVQVARIAWRGTDRRWTKARWGRRTDTRRGSRGQALRI